MTGSEFAASLIGVDLLGREKAILAAFAKGYVPTWFSTNPWRPVHVEATVKGKIRSLVFYTSPDYFAIGDDSDYLRMPARPATYQAIADVMKAILPSKRMVNAIWGAADCRLTPAPFPPGAAMITTPRFVESNDAINAQLKKLGKSPFDCLVAGDKKDVCIGPALDGNHVAIYGWHQSNGKPIQSYPGPHTVDHVDYSQGGRLTIRKSILDGNIVDLFDIFTDKDLNVLVSDQGPFEPRFPNTGSSYKPAESITDIASESKPAPAAYVVDDIESGARVGADNTSAVVATAAISLVAAGYFSLKS